MEGQDVKMKSYPQCRVLLHFAVLQMTTAEATEVTAASASKRKYLHKIAINFWHSILIGVPTEASVKATVNANVSNGERRRAPSSVIAFCCLAGTKRENEAKIPERAICIPTNEALTSCAHRCITLGCCWFGIRSWLWCIHKKWDRDEASRKEQRLKSESEAPYSSQWRVHSSEYSNSDVKFNFAVPAEVR